MFKKIVAAAALAIVASSSFAADQSGVYVGLDVGSTKITDLSGNKAGVGIFAGYQFTENFAVEGGYRQLGTWNFSESTTTADAKITQVHLSLVATAPLGDGFGIYGRLGYSNLKVNVNVNAGPFGGGSGSDSTSKGLYGVGVSYAFAPTVLARFEVQKPASDTTTIGASIAVKF